VIGSLRAGAHRVAITPTWPLPLAGHASRLGPHTGVASPLGLHALALESGDARALIVSADLIWWAPESVPRLRERIADRHGVPAETVVLHATHTHGGPQPSTRFAPSLGESDPRFTELLAERLDVVVGAAMERMTTVDVRVGASQSDLGVFRRREIDGRWFMAPDPTVPIDRAVHVARFDERDTGRVVAALVHFACHPTVSGETRVSADYPGATTRELSSDLGGAVVLFLQGCAGDIRPNLCDGDAFTMGDETDVTRIGHGLADTVRLALDSATPTRPKLSVDRLELPLPLANGQDVTLQIVSLRLTEDLRLLGLNAEPVGAYAAHVNAEDPGTWALGYTDGMLGYLPSDQQLHQGGYEPAQSVPYFQLPAPFAVGVESTVAAGIHSLLTR
jgi:hypothetical protein